MGNYLIRNQTPHELVIEGAKVVLKLAPLQRRRVGGDPGSLFGPAASVARCDHALDWEIEPVRSRRLLAAAWLAGAGIASGAAGVGAYSLGGDRFALWLGICVAAACAIGTAYIIGRGRTASTGHKATPRLEPTPERGDAWALVRDFVIATSQGVVIAVLVFVAVAAPASAIYYGTELSNVIVFDTWRHLSLVAGPDAQYIVVARFLQLILLIIVSIVPALMYFQFDREKLSTLVDRWLHAIFRLDPSLGTIADVDAKYGRRVEEFYGARLATGAGEPRKRLHDRSPVIIATLLIAIGWIVVLLNDAHRSRGFPSFQELFRPSPTPMTMGFLGAYFLSVQVTLRGYVRGDLKPKTYNVITVRILMAVILAWAMQALWGTNQLVLALSFVAGILPNTVLRRIRDVGGRRKADGEDDLQVKSPLSQLDEVDVYERTRLEEEGITSVQALARHDLIDLILSSRIPVPRLIDWVDQAVLLQHVPEGATTTLRRLGIRTATDYLQVCADETAFGQLSDALAKDPSGLSAGLLRIVLNGDEWLSYIENWRQHDGTMALEVHTYDRKGRLKIGSKGARPVYGSADRTGMRDEPSPLTRSPDHGHRAHDDDPNQLDGRSASGHLADKNSGQNGQLTPPPAELPSLR
jgi:hypothetical protein